MSANPDLTHIDVRYVADLARIRLTDAEARQFQRELDDILQYVNQLGELDTDGIEPTAHAAPRFNVMRSDEPGAAYDRDALLANAPSLVGGDSLRVPRVIEEGY